MVPTTLSSANLPQNQPISIDVTSDIIVASYPKGFYDAVNKFPIVKSGIVASAWGYKFNGSPMFEIDANTIELMGAGAPVMATASSASNSDIVKFSNEEFADELIGEDEIPF